MFVFEIDNAAWRFTLIKGKGYGVFPAIAENAALLDAGVGDINLIEISATLPPYSFESSSINFLEGSFYPAFCISRTGHLVDGITSHGFLSPTIAAAIAVAIPEDSKLPGLIGRYSEDGYADDCEETAKHIVERGMEERKRPIKEIKSISIQMDDIKTWGSVFSALILFRFR